MLLGALALCGASSAQEPETVEPGTLRTPQEVPPAETGEEARECTWGCLRWGRMCNVDPRGVYRCRRTCERFGEICE